MEFINANRERYDMKTTKLDVSENEINLMQDSVRFLMLSDACRAFPRKAEELQALLNKLHGAEQS